MLSSGFRVDNGDQPLGLHAGSFGCRFEGPTGFISMAS